jgi:hypothetical protein
MRVNTIRQKARIILNSDDAIKTTNENHIIPVRGEPIRFDGSAATQVDTNTPSNSDRILVINHGLLQNDLVTYAHTSGAIPPLINGTQYYVIYLNENIIQLSTTSGGAAIDFTNNGTGRHTLSRTLVFNGGDDTIVSDAQNTIQITNHRLATGQLVRYDTSGTALAGLTNSRDYYAIRVDDNTIALANSFQDATNVENGNPVPKPIDINVGVGTIHNIRVIVQFDSLASPVVDLVNERINIPAHGLKTGDMVLYQVDAATSIGGLTDNLSYYIISQNPNSIQLALTKAHAIATPPTPINLSTASNGTNHSFTPININPIPVCTNYRFNLLNLPLDLNAKCRLAVQSFDYVKNYPSTSKRVGAVYSKQLSLVDTYSTQQYKGVPLLFHSFAESFHYQNDDMQNNSIPLPSNMMQILQNGLDIFVDSQKNNFSSQDIQGNIDEDAFNMALVVYEIDEDEYIQHNIIKADNLPILRYSAVN